MLVAVAAVAATAAAEARIAAAMPTAVLLRAVTQQAAVLTAEQTMPEMVHQAASAITARVDHQLAELEVTLLADQVDPQALAELAVMQPAAQAVTQLEAQAVRAAMPQVLP